MLLSDFILMFGNHTLARHAPRFAKEQAHITISCATSSGASLQVEGELYGPVLGLALQFLRVLNPEPQGNGGLPAMVPFGQLHPHTCVLREEGMAEQVLISYLGRRQLSGRARAIIT